MDRYSAAPPGNRHDIHGSNGGGTKPMSEDGFNMSLRKYLKRVGVTSQQAIEEATRNTRENGAGGTVAARMVLTIDGKEINVIEGDIALGDDV